MPQPAALDVEPEQSLGTCVPVTAQAVAMVDKASGQEEGAQGHVVKRRPRARRRTVLRLVVVLVALVVAGTGASELLRGAWMVTPVLSGSMRPGLAVGGVVVSERVPVSSLEVRDVIVFHRPDLPSEQVVHRIIAVTRGHAGALVFKTQGDANQTPDLWSLSMKGRYAYRVRWAVPLVGYAAIFYQDHRGAFEVGCGAVLLVVALSFLYRRQPAGAHVADKGSQRS